MAALAADTPRVFDLTHERRMNEIPVSATTRIYDGAAVGINAGNARPIATGDAFGGFCYEHASNINGAAKAIRAKVYSRGTVKLSVVGVTADTDQGATVYAATDNDFTLTASTNVAIGKIVRVESGTTCLVEFEAGAYRSI